MGPSQFCLERRENPALLSLVIPLYNEAPMVPLLAARLDAFLPTLPCPCETILVNETDRSLRWWRP